MKLVIRLKPCKNNYKYRVQFNVVVTYNFFQKKSGFCLAKLGYILYTKHDRILCIDFKELGMWLNRGALLKNSVRKYIFEYACMV